MALFFNYSAGNLTATGQLPGGWAGMNGSPTFGSADGPAGINTVHCDGKTSWVYMPNVAIPINAQGLICGCGFTVSGVSISTGLMSIGGISDYCIAIQLSADGSIQAFNTNGGTIFSSPSGVFAFSTRNEVEVLISAFSAGGLLTVALNGVDLAGLSSIAIGQLTNLADGGTIHTVAMGGNPNSAAVSTVIVDSTYAGDTTGSFFNTLQGPCISQPMIPNGVGNASAWSVSGFANGWQALAVIPPAGDASYIYDDTPGDQEAVELSLPANLTAVYGLTVFADMRQDTSGGDRTVSLGVGNGSTQDYGSIYGTWGLGTTYATDGTPFSSNPFTGVAWALADLNTLQWAAKLAT